MCRLPILLVLLVARIAPVPHDTWLLIVDGTNREARVALSVRTGMDFPTSESAVAPERVRGRIIDPRGQARAIETWRVDDATASTCTELFPGTLPAR